MKIVLELPGIKAVSRNDTTGHFFNYKKQLNIAETWAWTFGKKHEYHFEKPVHVLIEAYYKSTGHNKVCDTPNIDDKIFTDILIRWVNKTIGTKIVNGVRRKNVVRTERKVWWLEDDSPTYLHTVTKRSYRSDQYKVVITITEAIIDE